jgi:hypothetical protein
MNEKKILKNADVLIKASAGKNLEQANTQEVYRAISRAVMAEIADKAFMVTKHKLSPWPNK